MRFLLLACLFLAACSATDKFNVSEVLDARDQSISTQNIHAYATLMHESYRLAAGATVLKQMETVFTMFDEVKMVSRDREIRILNATEAMCEQTYVLSMLSDGDWRHITQREQLTFRMVDGIWYISGGL